MKKLLILGGSRYVIPAIKAAHDLGVYVITCDYLPDNLGHKFADEYHNVSIVDKEAVLELATELGVDGILSFATDPGVIVASYVAEKLGLPTPPYKSVNILQNKDLFRDFLQKNGFNVPIHMTFSDKKQIEKSLDRFTFPMIVKPVDSAGSKGVSRIDDVTQLDSAVDYALEHSRNGKIIIEEFIKQAGCSSDTDCFSINNRLVFASFNCQYFDNDASNPYTPAFYTWPTDMPKDKVDVLYSELQRLIKLLNLGSSIYNIECRVGINGKPYIMEVSPRAGGNRLSEVLKLATGQDLISNNVKAALGMDLDKLGMPIYQGAWAECIVHSNKSGIFNRIEIDNTIREKYVVEEDIWVSKGDMIHAFSGANETIGTIIFKFESDEQAKALLINQKQWLKVIVD